MKTAVKEKQKNLSTQEKTVSLGQVSLYVKNLAVMKRFYTEVLQLEVIEESKDHIVLGHGSSPLVSLYTSSDASHALATEAGLYHLAIVFSSRRALARVLVHILTHWQHYFSGSADHLVSEAFYFTDPEGNGVELYFDKQRTVWQWENGNIKMASLYIDPASYIKEHHDTKGEVHDSTMGHVHLKVGDIPEAKKFYADVLGFEITAELPNALFVSRDKYHHHIGMNTWESAGAKKRENEKGLKSFDIIVHSEKEFTEIKKRLILHAIAFNEKNNCIILHDPWHTQINIYFV